MQDVQPREDLLPSQVRARILEEHASLRRCLASMRASAEGVDVTGDQALVRHIRALVRATLAVIDIENDLLLPTLRTIDAWGVERAHRLAAWHLELRARVMGLDTELSNPRRSTADTARRALGFVEDLERDLADEERLHLARELLAEAPIPTDFGGD